jgi:hypothetical protein
MLISMRGCTLLFLGLAFSTAMAADASDRSLNPTRIGWSSVEFKATKFLVSISSTVSFSDVTDTELQDILIDPGQGSGIEPNGQVHELFLQAEGLGRNSHMSLFVNSNSGAALQRTSHNSGNGLRLRIYRFTDIGAYQKTWRPADNREEKFPEDQWPEWSQRSEDIRPYPDEGMFPIITEPGGLFYIIGAANLNEPGDQYEIPAYFRGQVIILIADVAGQENIDVNYEDRTLSSVVKGKKPAIKINIRGRDIEGENNIFELLGLRGDIVMHLDPETRAPLQLIGKVRVAGQVVMRLQTLVRARHAK